MKQIARQGILTTIASYIGVVIGYFNVLWLYPYALDPEQIGTFRTIQDIAILLVPFAQMGLSNGLTKFFPKVNQDPSAFLTLSLGLSLIGFIGISILFFIFQNQIILAFQDKSPEILPFLGIILFIVLFSLLNSLLDAYSRSFYLIAFPTFIKEVILRLFLSILVGCYLINWINFELLMYGLAIVYFSALLSMLLYLLHKKVFRLNFNFKTLPPQLVRNLISYSSITFLGTAGALLIAKVDSIMVSAMIGLEANAIYVIGYSIALVIEMPRRAISQTVTPLISEYFENKQLREIQKLYKGIAVHQLLICALLFLGIWANVNNLYEFIPNSTIYDTGKWVIFWIGMGKISDIIFSVNGEILLYSKYYKFNVIATIIMFLAVVGLNLLLIPKFGLEGAAIASFLSMLIFNLIKYVFLKIKLNLEPFSWPLIKISSVALITYFVQYYIMFFFQIEQTLLDLVIRSLVIFGVYLAGIYVLDLFPASFKSGIKKIRSGS
jgi:O-antigen/teichoic acid export membrane protein